MPQAAPEYLRTSGVAPMDLDAIHSKRLAQWRSSGRGGVNWRQNNYRSNNEDDKQCYNCGGFGHIARTCSSPRRNNHGRQNNQGRVSSRINPSFNQSLNVVDPATSMVPEGELIDLSDHPDEESKVLQETLEEDKKYFDSLLSIKETELPLYMMSCNGCSVRVMIDSGASGCYVAPRVAVGLPTRLVSNREVETAGGHVLTINKQVTLPLDAQNYKHQVDAYILDTKFDIIVGRNWLKMVQPMPDWDLDTWKISSDGHDFILRPLHTRQVPELAYIISHRQVQRLERHKGIDDVFLCYVRLDVIFEFKDGVFDFKDDVF
ncbi:hypothetical protein INT45_004628 [Circinella minor]|uniref:CCHC-type domain-containing protein n=1 Tax=Circinella minor TaxID=1195481 RepID=A0A8H7R1C9_9FUNG|nr:hypothetical protein INT45_004628 [Circinella minor]